MKRLIDDLPAGLELSLLASEAIDTPPQASREKARTAALAALGAVAVGVAASAGAGAGAGASVAPLASTAARTVLAWKAIVAGALATGIAIGAGTTIAVAPMFSGEATNPTPSRTATPTTRVEVRSSERAPEAVPPSAPSSSTASSGSTASSASTPAPSIVAHAPGAPAAPVPAVPAAAIEARAARSAPDDLAAEIAALDVVRVALDKSDVSGALRQLDAYASTHPRGVLAPEAKALRVEALAKRGDTVEALRFAKELLDAHPDGPYRRRLENALGRTIP